jgi:hypothetical protein
VGCAAPADRQVFGVERWADEIEALFARVAGVD